MLWYTNKKGLILEKHNSFTQYKTFFCGKQMQRVNCQMGMLRY